MKAKAALYLRSSKDRADVSIDAQRRQLHELAASRNLIVVTEYVDSVESGKDTDRPGFQHLIADVRNARRGWNTILALDTSRIARRREISIMFEERECRRHGVNVVYASLPDMDPIMEMLLKSILQAMDEWHSLTSRAKGLSGMAENVRAGYRAGGRAPRGYRLLSIDTGAVREGSAVTKSKLELDPAVAPAVAAYLACRAGGEPRSRALAKSGLKAPVASLVDMERGALTYAGHTVWNRHAEPLQEGGYVGGAGKYRPREDWIIQRNTHPALIDDEQAEALMAAIEGRRHERTRPESAHLLLSGILRLPNGETWWTDRGASYRTPKGWKGKTRWIAAKDLDQAVLSHVVGEITSDTMVMALVKATKKRAEAQTPDALAHLHKQAQDVIGQIDRLAGLLASTTAPEPLLRKMEWLEQTRLQLVEQVQGMETAAAQAKAMGQVTEAQVRALLARLKEDMDAAPRERLKDAVAMLVEKVELDPATMDCRLTYRVGHRIKMASPRRPEPNPVGLVLHYESAFTFRRAA